MLLEGDLVRVVRVRLVAVDGFRAVGVLDTLLLRRLLHVVGGCRAHAAAAEARDAGAAGVGADGAARVAGYGGRGLEAVELGGGVELRLRGERGLLGCAVGV